MAWGWRVRRVVREVEGDGDWVWDIDGNGVGVSDGEVGGYGKGVEMKSWPKVSQLRPRPWRRIKVCRWGSERGGMERAGGKKPGGSGAILSVSG